MGGVGVQRDSRSTIKKKGKEEGWAGSPENMSYLRGGGEGGKTGIQ